MSNNRTGYGFSSPLQELNPLPIISQRAPTANDIDFKIMTIWLDQPNNVVYALTNIAAGAAIWIQVGNSLSDLDTLTGNAGGAVGADAAFDINLVGTATNGINVVGTPGTNTVTVGMNSPYSDGNFTFTTATSGTTRTLTVSNTANLAANSGANLQVTVGGAVSTGDPYVNFLVTGAGTYSLGIDNSDSDILKLTSGATPSTATTLMAWDAATPAINLYTYEYLINTTAGDGAGARASRIIAKGYQSGLEFTTLGYMEFSHFGAGDDEAGQWILYLNDGNDGNAPTNVMSIEDDTLTLGNPTHAGQVGISFRQGDNIASGWRFGYSANNSNNFYLYCYETASLSFYTSTVMRLNISAAGETTFPTQPAFLAYLAADALNKTGNGAIYTLGTDALTEVYDQNADFNVNGTFTAPVTGIYDLKAQISVIGCTVATTFLISIVTTARTYTKRFERAAGAQSMTMDISCFADMAATNTATVTIQITGEAGDTDDIDGDASAVTFFCGRLVC